MRNSDFYLDNEVSKFKDGEISYETFDPISCNQTGRIILEELDSECIEYTDTELENIELREIYDRLKRETFNTIRSGTVREKIMILFFDGYSTVEIARQCNQSRSYVTANFKDVVKKMRIRLGDTFARELLEK